MNGARHDFLAGAGLPRQENSRLRLRDFRDVIEDLPPAPRLSDDLPRAAHRCELLGERGDAALEPERFLARLRRDPRLLRDLLVREDEGDLVGDAPGDLGVLFAILRHVAREEVQAADRLPFQTDRHAEHRADPVALHQLELLRAATRFPADVGHQEEAPVGALARVVIEGDRLRHVRHALAGVGVDAHGLPVLREQSQRHPVVREDPEDGRRELFNLRDDPQESRDLTAAQPQKVAELSQQLTAWRKDIGAKLPQANPQIRGK